VGEGPCGDARRPCDVGELHPVQSARSDSIDRGAGQGAAAFIMVNYFWHNGDNN